MLKTLFTASSAAPGDQGCKKNMFDPYNVLNWIEYIGISPIRQYTPNKNSNIQERSPNLVK